MYIIGRLLLPRPVRRKLINYITGIRLKQIGSEHWQNGQLAKAAAALGTAAQIDQLGDYEEALLTVCTLGSGDQAGALDLLRGFFASDNGWDALSEFGGIPLMREEDYFFSGTSAENIQEIIDAGLLVIGYYLTAAWLHNVGRGNETAVLASKAHAFQALIRPHTRPGPEAKAFLLQNRISLEELNVFPPSWVNQIGHIGMLEIMLRMRQMGWWQGKAVVLARKRELANAVFLEVVTRQPDVYVVFEESEPALFADFRKLVITHGRPYDPFQPPQYPWIRWHDTGALALWKKREAGDESCIGVRDSFDRMVACEGADLEQKFNAAMREWGIASTGWYVCLHFRRSQANYGQANRNAGFDNYRSAIDYVVGRGGKVVLMGAKDEGKLPDIPGLINYPVSQYKSDLFDLMLIRRARLLIGTTSGLANVAISLGIPTAQVNCITTEYQPWNSRVRFCLKSVTRSDGTRYSQRDLSENSRYLLATSESMAAAGLVAQDNTAEEILATVQEVDMMIDGQFAGDDEILERWQRCLAQPYAYGGAWPAAGFLRLQREEFFS